MRKWLLVDDDGEDQDIFQIALSDSVSDIQLILAENGVEAISMLEEMSANDYPEIIFLDINMPRMDGKETLQTIKSSPKFSNIRVIMYTTAAEELEKNIFLSLGASEFLTKPSDINDLMDMLKKVDKTYSQS